MKTDNIIYENLIKFCSRIPKCKKMLTREGAGEKRVNSLELPLSWNITASMGKPHVPVCILMVKLCGFYLVWLEGITAFPAQVRNVHLRLSEIFAKLDLLLQRSRWDSLNEGEGSKVHNVFSCTFYFMSLFYEGYYMSKYYKDRNWKVFFCLIIVAFP